MYDLLCVGSFLDHRTLVDRCSGYVARYLQLLDEQEWAAHKVGDMEREEVDRLCDKYDMLMFKTE